MIEPTLETESTKLHFYSMQRKVIIYWFSTAVVIMVMMIMTLVLHLTKTDFRLYSKWINISKCPPQMISKKGVKSGRINYTFFMSSIIMTDLEYQATCDNTSAYEDTLLILIPSGSTKYDSERRMSIRKTWGNPENLRKNNSTIRFFLGHLQPACMPSGTLLREATTHKDMVFISMPLPDIYINLSLKTLSMLVWVNLRCSIPLAVNSDKPSKGLRYLLKSDQDSYWNLQILRKYLSAFPRKDVFVYGNIQKNALVHRNKNSNWYTSLQEFNESVYPSYATGGPGYVITASAVKMLLMAAENEKVFWLEDVYITGILTSKTSQVYLAGNSRIYYDRVNFEKFTQVKLNNILATHYLSNVDMLALWNKLKRSNLSTLHLRET